MVDPILVERVAGSSLDKVIVEKVMNMMYVLQKISQDPELKDSYVLIGGTAINHFSYDLPRMSVDIDMDYILHDGTPFDHKIIDDHCDIISRIADNLGMKSFPHKNLNKLRIILEYKSNYSLEGKDEVKLDIGYLFNCTIFPPQTMKVKQLHPKDSFDDLKILVEDPHELWAGKALALVYNTDTDPKPEEVKDLYSMFIARHLFDVSNMMMKVNNDGKLLDIEKLQMAFILKGVPRIKNLYNLRGEHLKDCSQNEKERQLDPFIIKGGIALDKMKAYSRDFLDRVCGGSWDQNQKDFVRAFQEEGEYRPELLFGKENKAYCHLLDNEYLKKSAKNMSK